MTTAQAAPPSPFAHVTTSIKASRPQNRTINTGDAFKSLLIKTNGQRTHVSFVIEPDRRQEPVCLRLIGAVPITMSDSWLRTYGAEVTRDGILERDDEYVFVHVVKSGTNALEGVIRELIAVGLVDSTTRKLADVIDQILAVIPDSSQTQDYIGVRSQIRLVQTTSISAIPHDQDELWIKLKRIVAEELGDPEGSPWKTQVYSILEDKPSPEDSSTDPASNPTEDPDPLGR
jgi:hypothetical protein